MRFVAVVSSLLVAFVPGVVRADLESLANYEPQTQITSQAAIDLDMDQMNKRLGLGELIKARNVYIQGGYSQPMAKMILTDATGNAKFEAGTRIVGQAKDGSGDIGATLAEPLAWQSQEAGDKVAVVQYDTSDVQSDYTNCKVGGLYTFHKADISGCFTDNGTLTFVEQGQRDDDGFPYKYSYDIRVDNYNGRTIQDMSLKASATMKACDACDFYPDFQTFVDYYGDTDYGDKWVDAAHFLEATGFESGRGNADFSTFTGNKQAQAEAISKGAGFLNILMDTIRQMEDAIAICNRKCKRDDCDTDAMHAWDTAVAFFAGSLEGQDASGTGVLMYQLVDRRCRNFNTCGANNNEDSGVGYVNLQIIDQFKRGQQSLMGGHCAAAATNKDTIVGLMKVPLIQGVLRYAFVRDRQNSNDAAESGRAQAEGATWTATMLPWLNKCNSKDADIVYKNMKVGSNANDVDFVAVQKAITKNYDCMNVKCEWVGGIWTVDHYAKDAGSCSGGGDSSSGSVGRAFGITLAFTAAFVTLGMLYVRMRRRRHRILRQSATTNIAAVSEIA